MRLLHKQKVGRTLHFQILGVLITLLVYSLLFHIQLYTSSPSIVAYCSDLLLNILLLFTVLGQVEALRMYSIIGSIADKVFVQLEYALLVVFGLTNLPCVAS